MKNIIIIVLAVVAIVSLIEVNKMADRASYWMNRCDAAESVISQVEEQQEDYVLDVLCEGDAWAYWQELGGDED
jgi:competence protein ComGC